MKTRMRGKHWFSDISGGKLKERRICACELPHLSLAEGVFSEMLSVEGKDKRERDPSMTVLLSLTDIR